MRGPGEAEVGLGLADALGLRPGATLAVQLEGAGEVRFRVVGVVRALERDGRIAYVQPDRLLAADPALGGGSLAVKLEPGADRAAVEDDAGRARRAAAARRGGDDAQRRLPRRARRGAARRRARDRARLPLRARAGAGHDGARAAGRGRAPARRGRATRGRSALLLAGAALAVAVPADGRRAAARVARARPAGRPARRGLRGAPARAVGRPGRRSWPAACSCSPRPRPGWSPAAPRASRSSAGCGRSDAGQTPWPRLANRLLAAIGGSPAAVCLPAAAAGAAADDRPVAGGSTLRGHARRPRRRRRAGARAGRAARATAAGAARPGEVLATLVQLTDLHVRDEESPGRVPFLDRLGAPFGSTFRPQEALSTQVLAAAVRAANAVAAGRGVRHRRPARLGVRAPSCDQALAVLDGGDGRPGHRPPGLRGRPGGRRARPALLPPGPRRAAPSGAARRAPRAPFGSPGLRAPVVPGARQPRPARAGRDAADRAARRVRDRRRGWSPGLDPDVRADPDTDSAAAVRALLAAGAPGRSRTVAARPGPPLPPRPAS